MGYGNGGGYNRGGGFNRGGNGGGGRGTFQAKPGAGTLFYKNDKRGSQTAPAWDGYWIADRVIQPGEKIKLVGWEKDGPTGPMINLKEGRPAQQPAPGYNDGGQYQGQPPQQGGYQAPARGGYATGSPSRQGYQAAPTPGAYAGGGYNGQPARTYPPAGQAPAAAPAPAPTQPPMQHPAPQAEEDLPF